ncbi:Secreted protein [Mycena sanguinolenta]|uniref:Secreted protein n=1 Tax=Mycena sanguinolenta TaxID=230812 RepID=A0A8H7DL17_9AGAR|nr:Secreted protein [Mycena sanguinolenta]
MLFLFSILVAAVLSSAAPPQWYTRNRDTIQKIYNLTIFPANAKIIAEGAPAVPPGLFNANATGRVTPVGEFFGFQDSFEYFFGLAPLPTGSPPNGAISNATLVEFTSGCPEVAASTVWLTVSTINSDNSTGPFITALKQTAFWRFDDEGAVLQYEAWIPDLDLFSPLDHGYDQYTLDGMNRTIQGICALQDTTCVGSNTVYDGISDCVQTLAAKPYGRSDESWGDNVVCRGIHVLLTKIRPEVHCAHVGPTGGGKCIDVEYNDVYFNDEFLFGAPLGTPFTCDYGED